MLCWDGSESPPKGGQRGCAGEQASCFEMGLMCQHNKKINLCKFSTDGLPCVTCCCSTPFFFFVLCKPHFFFLSFLCHVSYHGRSQDKPSSPHQLALGPRPPRPHPTPYHAPSSLPPPPAPPP